MYIRESERGGNAAGHEKQGKNIKKWLTVTQAAAWPGLQNWEDARKDEGTFPLLSLMPFTFL